MNHVEVRKDSIVSIDLVDYFDLIDLTTSDWVEALQTSWSLLDDPGLIFFFSIESLTFWTGTLSVTNLLALKASSFAKMLSLLCC